MKAAILAASLIPLSISTPLETSTAHGRTCLIAVATFAASSPPDSTTGTGSAGGISDQSKVCPVPPWLPGTNASSRSPCAARKIVPHCNKSDLYERVPP